MWLDRVSNPGPLTYESGALPTVLRGPACIIMTMVRYFMAVTIFRKGSFYFASGSLNIMIGGHDND